jgi:2-polyprenyl-6-methoxyphenol hydroxylase-like FAD-dependent oxidoreductase
MRESRTEVVVAGAGPVGLWTALLLAEAGVEVAVIDQEARTTTRSYACALHPSTLGLFHRQGLADVLLEQGKRVQTMAFYDGAERRAEVSLAGLGGEFPFLLILPQSILEGALEDRLRQKGVAVHWQHRFDGVAQETDTVAVTVEELTGTSTGYIIPHWETVVKDRRAIQAQFLVGADGANSLVRQRLGIGCESVGAMQFFAAYEFESDEPVADEIRVVLDERTTNVLWPLAGNKSRWTFQVAQGEIPEAFPEKDRRAARVANPNVDERVRQFVEKVAHKRAPWFSARVAEVTWCTEVAFQQRVSRQFGRGGCWLAGDAAHQTGPVGVQSMNVGFQEGEALAGALRHVLRDNAGSELLGTYEKDCRAQWQRLLGLDGGLKARADTTAWVRERVGRILSCLPGSGNELRRLAGQLRLDMA